MYADVVLGLNHHAFEDALEIAKEDRGYFLDTELEANDLIELVGEYKQSGRGRMGQALSARM